MIGYETDARGALEKWLLKGNLLSRAFLVMHPGTMTAQFKDIPERFQTSLFSYFGVPSLYAGKQLVADDGTVTEVGLMPAHTGLVADLNQVTLVPYQDAYITENRVENPLMSVFTGRSAYGINIQNPDAVLVFNPNAAPA